MKAKIVSSGFWVVLLVCGSFGQDRSSTAVTINGKKVSIDYGRPSLKGRDMLGQVTGGTVWRLGSNKATEISSTGDLVVGEKVLKAGKYSLWAKKTDNGWLLMFHPQTGIWGAPVLTEGVCGPDAAQTNILEQLGRRAYNQLVQRQRKGRDQG
jgi:hypothetical protein